MLVETSRCHDAVATTARTARREAANAPTAPTIAGLKPRGPSWVPGRQPGSACVNTTPLTSRNNINLPATWGPGSAAPSSWYLACANPCRPQRTESAVFHRYRGWCSLSNTVDASCSAHGACPRALARTSHCHPIAPAARAPTPKIHTPRSETHENSNPLATALWLEGLAAVSQSDFGARTRFRGLRELSQTPCYLVSRSV